MNSFHFDKENFDKNLSCKDVQVKEENGECVVTGKTEADDDSYAMYWAANPADYRQSFTGSGLPFPNPYVAYELADIKIQLNEIKPSLFSNKLKIITLTVAEMELAIAKPR